MRWKTKHNEGDWSPTSIASDRPQSTPPLPVDHLPVFPSSIVSPLAASFVDLGRDFSPSPTLSSRPSALLITKDIEALLEEDERVRSAEADLGTLAPIEDPNTNPAPAFGGLPPPPRGQRTRHHKFQSEPHSPTPTQTPTPTLSGRYPEFDFVRREREGESSLSMGVRRPSAAGGAGAPASSVSVSEASSIKGVPAAESTGPTKQESLDSYTNTMQSRSSLVDAKLVNRLSDFGPKPPRRSLDSPTRDSWGSRSRYSGYSDYMPSPRDDASLSSITNGGSRNMTQHQPRPLLSHAPPSSRESVYSTVSSYDPPSTIHEPRISVSSTIYPASAYNELPSPVADPISGYHFGAGNRTSLAHSEADSVYGEDQRPSIVDASDHASPAHETQTPVPLRTAYASPVGVYPSGTKRVDGIDRVLPPRRPVSSSSDISLRSASSQKPAVPTTPKPDFRRSRSVQPPSKTPMISKPPSPSSSPKLSGLIPYQLLTSFSPDSNSSNNSRGDSLPPTTNYLNPQERADLIRKTRKLTQVFGQTPSPMSGPGELADSPVLNNCLLPGTPSRKAHARGALSVSDALNASNAGRPLRDSRLTTITAERTSSLSPIRFRPSWSNQENESDESLSPFESPDAATPMSSRKKSGDASIRSPTIISASDSFIEMSDYDTPNINFPSTHSFAESLTDEQQAEEERRRKRDRLAKLHRFLGSRVPMELVLGRGLEVPLPPLAPDSTDADSAAAFAEGSAKSWMLGKRRNSLASSDPMERLADSERVKEELSEREKAIVVKRALKMERMFGEQPPQDLFRSDHARPVHRAAAKIGSQSKAPAKSAPSSPVGGNVNKSSYMKGKSKHNRPGTAESSKRLLGASFESGETESINDGQSDVYFHYRNSLVSLTNIVDNDDKRSLVELHEYINEDPSAGKRGRRESHAGSIRSERRHSLPLRTSHTSLASQYTLSEVKAEITPFEVRRRRAAKLSHFFGVSYRDLFGEVLDSIEMSVREDEGKGTLNADEAKDLIVQLTKLKARRDELSMS